MVESGLESIQGVPAECVVPVEQKATAVFSATDLQEGGHNNRKSAAAKAGCRAGSVDSASKLLFSLMRNASGILSGANCVCAKAAQAMPYNSRKVKSKRMSRVSFLFHSRCRCPDRLASPKDGQKNKTLHISRPAADFNA